MRNRAVNCVVVGLTLPLKILKLVESKMVTWGAHVDWFVSEYYKLSCIIFPYHLKFLLMFSCGCA